MDAKYSRGVGITSLGFPQGAQDQFFLGLVEGVVVSRSFQVGGLLFEYSAGEIFGRISSVRPSTIACSMAFSSSRTFPGQL